MVCYACYYKVTCNNLFFSAPNIFESQAPQQQQERIRRLIYLADQPYSTTEQLNETLVFDINAKQDMPEADTKACYLRKEFVIDLSMPDRYVDLYEGNLTYHSTCLIDL
jgi:hypothetical protein